MKTNVKEILSYCVWLCLYILCVGLGTVEQRSLGVCYFGSVER